MDGALLNVEHVSVYYHTPQGETEPKLQGKAVIDLLKY